MVRQSVQSILVLALVHNASALLKRLSDENIEIPPHATVTYLVADNLSTCDRIVNSDVFHANAYTINGTTGKDDANAITCRIFNTFYHAIIEPYLGTDLVYSDMIRCSDPQSNTEKSCSVAGCCGNGQCTSSTDQKKYVCKYDRDYLLDIELSTFKIEHSSITSDVKTKEDCRICSTAGVGSDGQKYSYFRYSPDTQECARMIKVEKGTEVRGSVSGKCHHA
ncbi:hypothetical protein ABG067_005237 [Albugo candida]